MRSVSPLASPLRSPHSRLPEDYTARLRSQCDRLPSRCDRCCRRRTCPFAARLAATRNAPPPRRRSDAARRHRRPPLRGRLGHCRSPAPRRGARPPRPGCDRRARCFCSGPRARLSVAAAGRTEALPESPPPRLAPERRSSGADPASYRGLPYRPPSSPPLALPAAPRVASSVSSDSAWVARAGSGRAESEPAAPRGAGSVGCAWENANREGVRRGR
jgi:hypothetical protein